MEVGQDLAKPLPAPLVRGIGTSFGRSFKRGSRRGAGLTIPTPHCSFLGEARITENINKTRRNMLVWADSGIRTQDASHSDPVVKRIENVFLAV
jgi:hypothetical protein